MARCAAIRRIPSASVSVTTAGSPSGIAATASVMAVSAAAASGCPCSSVRVKIRATTTAAMSARRLPSRSSWRCSGVMPSGASRIIPAMRPISVSMPVAVTTISPRPRVTTVFMKLMLPRSASGAFSAAPPACFSTGSDSPVSAASSICSALATQSRPSAGVLSPASSTTRSPGTSSAASISCFAPSRRTRAFNASIFFSAPRLCSARCSW